MMMYSMTPFGRNNSLSNFFDNFDRHFFSDMNTPQVPTLSAPIFVRKATTMCWTLTCLALTGRTFIWSFRAMF